MCRRLFFSVSVILTMSLVWASPAEAADSGLMGWWRLDGDALDSSGADHHGILQGNPQSVDGKIGGALNFDGDDNINIGGVKLPTNAFTIALWFNPASTLGSSSTRQDLLYWQVGNGRPHITFNRSGTGEVGLWPNVGGDFNGPVTTTRSWAAGTWYHIAGTFDGANFKIYVNGKLENAVNHPGIHADASDLLIGSRTTQRNYFQGKIDDVRLYNHALTENELLSAMEGTGTGYPLAHSPKPEDGALLDQTWGNLTWKSGDFAVSHDVYLGDNLEDVNEGTGDTFRGNQTSMSFFVGFPGNPYPDGLVPGKTYYWRIDEVNEVHPDSPWKGNIWSFSIAPRTAYDPSPADGAEFVDPDVTLSWTPGFGAKLHYVYFGEDFDSVNNAKGGLPQGAATYKPASLQSEKVYYWRVDESDGVSTYKGDIWAFTTPGAAGNPQPARGATGVQMLTKLSWTSAANATSHQVYFGTDRNAVRSATTASSQYKGSKAIGNETLDPGKLTWHSDYYWRVDAVYNTGTVKGLVWSFRTADFITVDDFESYNDIDPPDPANNRIFDMWIDGFASPTTNGALVGNDLPPYAERSVVHSGAQSMPYRYDNNLKTSEATLTLVYPRDWTQEGVTKLSLWFRGATANAAERMYVVLNGSSVVYHDDPAVTQKAGWTQWIIDLQAFQSIILTNVNTITLGFGTKGSPAAGGSGKMYFDDIRLYRPQSEPQP